MEKENENMDIAVEALVLLRNAQVSNDVATQVTTCTSEASCQTAQLETKSVSSQTLPFNETVAVPYIAPLPVAQPTTHNQPVTLIENDDEATKFYTGLPSWASFMFLIELTSTNRFLSRQPKVSPADGLLLTLMRVRLNLTMADLAYRFHIGTSTASTVFSNWIDLLCF